MVHLRSHDGLCSLANQLTLDVTHFARGSFPVLADEPVVLTVNRMLSIVRNPRGAANRIMDGGRVHVFEPGTIYFVPAGYAASIRLDDELEFVSIQFKVELYFGVELFSAFRSARALHRPAWVRRLRHAFEETNPLVLALTMKEHATVFARALAAGEGVQLGDGVDGEGEDGGTLLAAAARFAPYKEALDYLSAHCTARTRVADLAAAMHRTRETFTRRFTAETGITPKHFLDGQLLRRARDLLRAPRATAREVAYELEFSSEYVFSRFFKARAGMTPGAYTKLWRPPPGGDGNPGNPNPTRITPHLPPRRALLT